MGKKKSKASKQKQAKAKSMTNRRKQGAKFNTPMSVGGAIAKDAQPKRNLNANRKKKLKAGKPNLDVKKNQPQKRDADFEREFRALEERQYQAGISGKSKSKTMEFAQPTLQLDKKPTTAQLVADAASHLGGMQELGRSNIASMHSTNPNMLQILAAQKRQENYMQQQNKANMKNDVGKDNKFWALQNDSDGEEEQKSVAALNFAAPSFNFAAPSFNISSTPAPSNSFGNNLHDDIDPDL